MVRVFPIVAITLNGFLSPLNLTFENRQFYLISPHPQTLFANTKTAFQTPKLPKSMWHNNIQIKK
jgi:hypothetical protein